MIRRVRKKHTKSEVLSLMLPLVREWFDSRFESLTEPQAYAVPLIHARHNVLISSPTGSGKTLTAFLSIINELLAKQEAGELEDRIYCVYVSPLKALANDINKNLKQPLAELSALARERGMPRPGIRVAVRSGDTTAYERQKMAKKPPHILITTPESLAIILSTPKFSQALDTAEWIIMDEIHDICSSKRGVQLSVNLERLQDRLEGRATRIGLSATQAPIEEMARFLGGYEDGEPRPVRLVEVASSKVVDISVATPVEDMTSLPFEIVNARLYEKLRDIVLDNTTTLIFTNTRSGTENVLLRLGELGVEGIAAHHGSLSRETRLGVEDSLKSGELRAVVSSTSLELGIDIGSIDMVCQIGSPKSIAKGLQRIGRSGHGYGEVSRGNLIAFDNDDLVECAVLAKKAGENYIDRVDLPRNSLDVLAQTIVGMALERVWHVDDAYRVIRNSYSFHDLPREDFDSVVDYLSSRDMPHVYSKIWYDPDTGEFGRKRSSRLIYYLNSGTIPEEANYKVYSDSGGRLGELSEGFVERLSPGDVFVLGGKAYEFIRARGMSLFVKPATGRRPTIPSWTGEMLPRSFDLSVEIGRFRARMRELAAAGKDTEKWLMRHYPVDRGGARSIARYIGEQMAFNGAVPTDRELLLEGYQGPRGNLNIIFHYCFGRRTNDALARAYAMAVSNRYHCNVSVSVNDDCFMLTVPRRMKLEGLENLVNSRNIVELLEEAIRDTELFKQRFRHCSTRGFMVLRNYRGREVPVGRQQQRSQKVLRSLEGRDDFPMVRETVREILEQAMDLNGAVSVLRGIEDGSIAVNHAGISDVPSPFAHNIVLVGMSDIVLMHDRSALLKELHRKVLMRVGGESALKPEFDPDKVTRYFRDRAPAVSSPGDIPGLVATVGPLELFTRKSASIYDFGDIPEDTLAEWAARAVESNAVVSVWAGRALWAHPDELEIYAGLHSSRRVPGELGRRVMEVLDGGPMTAGAVARKLDMDPRGARQALGALERSYAVARVGRDRKGNVVWAPRKVRVRKPGIRQIGKLVLRHLEHFAPLSADELAYDLALDKEMLTRILVDLESGGEVASGSFTEPELQYMLTADREGLRGNNVGDLITRSQVDAYHLARHFASADGLDGYFDRYGVVWLPQDLMVRDPGLYDEWLERRRTGEILHGRFMDGSVCFVRRKDAARYVTAYRREAPGGAGKEILNIIAANPGIDMTAIARKSELPAAKVRDIMEKLDRNMYVVRKFADRESWSSANRYEVLDIDPEPGMRGSAVRDIVMTTLRAYAPLSMRSLTYATGFSGREIREILAPEMASGRILEIKVQGGGRARLLLPADRLDDLRDAGDRTDTASIRILTLYDPLVQHHRIELRRRYGDAWYFPVFQGARPVGMMEMWEMSGCIDIRQLVLDDAALLPGFLDALDDFARYYRRNLMDVIRFRSALGREPAAMDREMLAAFEEHGYARIRDWLVKGDVADMSITETQLFSYLLGKNRVLPESRLADIGEGLRLLGGFRSDEEAMARCRHTVPLERLHALGAVMCGQMIPGVLTYALPGDIALHKAALAREADGEMRVLMNMLDSHGRLKWKEIVDRSPLGYRNTLDAKQRLTSGLLVHYTADRHYELTPETRIPREAARLEVVRRAFSQFGIFSAEHLSFYLKGEYRMFEVRSILHELEEAGELLKGYVLEGSDTLFWLAAEDKERITAPPVQGDFVLTERDRLTFYLHPWVRKKLGVGSAWILIRDGDIAAAARVRRRKGEFILKDLFGDKSAWQAFREHAAALGKRMRWAEPDREDDDIEDWYENYLRPGGG